MTTARTKKKKKAIKLKWLGRQAFTLPIYYTLATSKKILNTELRRLKFNDTLPGVNKGSGATTNFLVNQDGGECAIVCLFDHKYPEEQIYALLTHEAIHIFQAICDSIGEKEPSKEFQAWTIQTIAQNLFYEYNRQVKSCRPRIRGAQ